MKKGTRIALAICFLALIVTSSHSTGEMPDNAQVPGTARSGSEDADKQMSASERPGPDISDGQGFIPPPIDLSHLRPQRAPYRPLLQPPVAWDWRDHGGVTSVKNQNPYNTCWAFAAIGDLESKVLINNGLTRDYSEFNVIACAGNQFYDQYGYSCYTGGNAWIAANYLAQNGSVMETCDQYPGSCPNFTCTNPSCFFQMSVKEWRVITGDLVSPGDEYYIKDAIVHYGPVYTAIYSSWGEFQAYDTDTCLTYSGAEDPDHAVLIVGWNDTLCGGEGAWIVKNSWGTSWGDGGYFYIKYGHANIGSYTSVITECSYFDDREKLYYWDDYGFNWYAGWADDTDWGMVEFTPAWSGKLHAVDIWTTSNPCNYRIYVYDDFSGGSLQNVLAGPIDGSLQESGYYSIELPAAVDVYQNDNVYIAVRLNTPGFQYCLALDHYGPMETNKSWASNSGSVWVAEDLGDMGYGDLGIRGRVLPECNLDIPQLDIEIIGTETVQIGPQQYNRFWVEVTNRDEVPDVVLEPAPDLYPYTPANSRGHVTIYNAYDYQFLGEFTELSSPDELDSLYFDVATILQPPDSIILQLSDERCYVSYGSDVARVPSLACTQAFIDIAGYEEVSYADSLWEIRVLLENTGPGIAYDVSATMSHSLPWLVIPDPMAYYGNIPLDATADGDGDTYTLDLSNSPGDTFTVSLTISCRDACSTLYQSAVFLELCREVTGSQTPEVNAFRLVQNYPNPFNPNTTIRYEIPAPCHVRMKIYDVNGRLVRTLVDMQRDSGPHIVTWDGTDNHGRAVASGIYFYRVTAGSFAGTKKMVLLK